MVRFLRLMRAFARDQSGATSIDYMVILSLIVLGLAVAMSMLGDFL